MVSQILAPQETPKLKLGENEKGERAATECRPYSVTA